MQTRIIGGVGIMTTVLLATMLLGGGSAPATATTEPSPGQLCIVKDDGKVGDLCPLERTSVVADISGFGARVTVTQVFKNPSREAIEAIYTFPLPNDAAVDRMQMKIGDRIVEGDIMRREEARIVYEAAKNAGHAAALLDQERPNIFTQSVANIMPGSTVQIIISYVQTLKSESSDFEFVFPMVVGPRYLGNASDPEKISPPITPKGTRTGTNIELTVNIDAGAKIQEFKSVLHEVKTSRSGENRLRVSLKRADEIPNRDFILRYSVATEGVKDGFIAHMGDKGGFFTLFLMPPKEPTATQVAPKEVIFVMDQSGSQSGFPIEKSRELTLKLLKKLGPADTFNVYGFNTTVNALWPEPKLNTTSNIAAAEQFIRKLEANGGTNLREGAIAALQHQTDPDRLRLVIFNTDGYVGDEEAILKAIHEHRDRARMYTFGIGNSVNRYLIEEMSIAGRGDVEIVTLAENADAAVERLIQRTEKPILTDVSVSIDGSPVDSVLPEALPDVFSERPVMIVGRYSTPGIRTVTLNGKLGGRPWSRTIEIDFPARANAPALESLWARRKVDELTRHTFLSNFLEEGKRATQEQVIEVALEFGIMTQYTSFVAVEKRVVNVGGKQRTIAVPIEMADGVSYEGIFGGRGRMSRSDNMATMPATKSMSGGAGGFGGSGGVYYSAQEAESTSPELLENLPPSEARVRRYESKVDKGLREAKGVVEVQLWLTKLDDVAIAELKKRGLKVDGQDKGLKVVFGTCDVKVLVELAQLDAVMKIKKL